MKSNVRGLVLAGLFFTGTSLSYAQDTLRVSETEVEIDTVIIHKEPVTIVKQIYIEEPAVEKNSGKWSAELYAAPFYTSHHFKACPSYEEYVEQLDRSLSPSAGYMAGASLRFLHKHFFAQSGIALTGYRDLFKYSSSSGNYSATNTYQYIEVSLSGGYAFHIKKTTCILHAGITAGALSSVKGKTVIEETEKQVVQLKDANHYRPYVLGTLAGIKFSRYVSNRVSIIAEPFFRTDLYSISEDLTPFTQTRTSLGIKMGIAFGL